MVPLLLGDFIGGASKRPRSEDYFILNPQRAESHPVKANRCVVHTVARKDTDLDIVLASEVMSPNPAMQRTATRCATTFSND
jgi:hypothetical protein